MKKKFESILMKERNRESCPNKAKIRIPNSKIETNYILKPRINK